MAGDGSTLGEFDRISRYFAPLSHRAPGAFGLTDDAAVLPPADSGRTWVVTVDALVAGVHFLPDDPADLVARKALRVNLSDLAAMGAEPVGYTLVLALPVGQVDADAWLEDFAGGLALDQDTFSVSLMGGDSVSTPGPITVSITAFGLVEQGKAIRRSGARVGDQVWVSGTVGDGALGLDVLQRRLIGDFADLADRYHLPRPRVALGRALVGLATAALDVSDGLVQDAGHLADQSAVRVVIDAPAIPLSQSATTLIGDDPDLFVRVLAGGDDYELVFSAPAERASDVLAAASDAGVSVTRIGRVESGSGVVVLDRNGDPLEGASIRGWSHF